MKKDEKGRRYLTAFGWRLRFTTSESYLAVAVFKVGKEWVDPWTRK